jgi:hypothetical protein
MMRSDPDIDGHGPHDVLAMSGINVQPTRFRPGKENGVDGGVIAHKEIFGNPNATARFQNSRERLCRN